MSCRVFSVATFFSCLKWKEISQFLPVDTINLWAKSSHDETQRSQSLSLTRLWRLHHRARAAHKFSHPFIALLASSVPFVSFIYFIWWLMILDDIPMNTRHSSAITHGEISFERVQLRSTIESQISLHNSTELVWNWNHKSTDSRGWRCCRNVCSRLEMREKVTETNSEIKSSV